MEEKISGLISSITSLVEKLNDVTTLSALKAADNEPRNPMGPSPEKRREKSNKELAEDIVDAQTEQREKDELKKSQSRKIQKSVMPVSIVNIDDKVLKKLKGLMPTAGKITVKDREKKTKTTDPFGGLLKKLGLGALALVIAPIVALVNMFKEIGKQKWFLKLKDFVKNSKLGQGIGKILTNIQKAFTSIGKRFPAIGKLMGNLFGKTGSLTGLFGKIKTLGSTVMKLLKDSKILSIAGKVGKFLGKLFLPITILWGAIETVMGAVKGYKEDGVAGSIKGGVNALFDFLVVDLVNLIVSIPAWFLKKIGLKNVAKALQDNVAGVMQSIKDMFGGIVDTVVGVFTLDPKRIAKGLKGLWEGQKDFVGFVIGLAVDPVVNFLVKDVFKWGDPKSPFSFKKDVLDPAVNKIKKWFKGLLSLGKKEDGSWSLSLFINNVEQKIKDFFIGIFTWAKTTGKNKDGEWNLGTFIGGVFESVKSWLVGLFDWEEVSKKIKVKANWLKTMVTDTWKNVKEWFKGLVTWANTDTDESGQKDGFIVSTIKGVVKGVETYFKKLFTFDSKSKTITSLINITTWLPNLVVSGLTSVSAWFLKLFGFDEEAKNVKDWGKKFSIGDMVVNAVKSAWKWLKGKFPNLAKFLTESWNALTGATADVGAWLWGKVSKVWDWLKALWSDPKKTIEDSWNKATKNIKGIGNWVWGKLKAVWDWLKLLFTDPKTAIKNAWDAYTKNVTGLGSWLWSKVKAVWDWFGEKFPDTKKYLQDQWKSIMGEYSDLKSYLWSKISPVWDWIKTLFTDPKTALKKAWETTTEGVTSVGSWIGKKMSGAWDAISDSFSNLGDAIYQAMPIWMQNPGKWMRQKFLPITDFFYNLFDFDSHILGIKEMIRDKLDLPEWLAKRIGIDSNKMAAEKVRLEKRRVSRAGDLSDMSYASEMFEGDSNELAMIAKHMEWYKIKKSGGGKWGKEQLAEAQKKAMNWVVSNYGAPVDIAMGPILARKKVLAEVEQAMGQLLDSSSVADNAIGEAMNRWVNEVTDAQIYLQQQKQATAQPPSEPVESQIQGDSQRMRDFDADFFGKNSSISESEKLDDFIWRPGQPVKKFNKGDLLMGIHEESAKNNTVQDDRVVNRMDKLIETQQKTLEVLQQAGLMDKQGNAVINNGGNTTNISNTIRESNIMSFRDKVIGRLNDSSHK